MTGLSDASTVAIATTPSVHRNGGRGSRVIRYRRPLPTKTSTEVG